MLRCAVLQTVTIDGTRFTPGSVVSLSATRLARLPQATRRALRVRQVEATVSPKARAKASVEGR